MESDLYRSSVYASCGSTHYGAYTMAKAYSLELCEYLNFLFENRSSKDMSDDELDNLVLWNETVKELCKIK